MKKLFILLVSLLFGYVMSAQDIITKNDGTDIQAKVLEVEQSQVKYKKYSNLEGPTYTISISDILMITYENGEREMYNSNKESDKKSVLPQGVMTLNPWSGKISVDGVTIEKEMWDRFFTPEDLQLYSSGNTISIVGGVLMCIGALPMGYSLGYMATSGDDSMMGLLIGGGAAFIGGALVSIIGSSKMKKAISNYNSALAFQPEFHIGATPNGVGIALAF